MFHILNVRTQLRPFEDRSFDHPVGAQEDRLRDCDAERFGGLEVGDKLELGRLLDGQVAAPRTLENSVDVARGPAGNVDRVRPIRHEAPGKHGDVYLRTLLIHGARAVLRVSRVRHDAKSRWAEVCAIGVPTTWQRSRSQLNMHALSGRCWRTSRTIARRADVTNGDCDDEAVMGNRSDRRAQNL